MINNYSKSTSNGFTLIEIIASIAILGMVIVVFLPIFPQILAWNNSSEQELTAGNLLEQAVYDVKQEESIVSNLIGKSIPKCENGRYAVSGDLPTYSLNGIAYSTSVFVCQSTKEKELNLYRANIKITSTEGNTNETYTYLKGDSNE